MIPGLAVADDAEAGTVRCPLDLRAAVTCGGRSGTMKSEVLADDCFETEGFSSTGAETNVNGSMGHGVSVGMLSATVFDHLKEAY